jgi:hypothetical protein
MGVDRVQKRISKEAVRAAKTRVDVAGRIEWAAVATCDITRGVAFVRVVKTELSVIKEVERFSAEFERGASLVLKYSSTSSLVRGAEMRVAETKAPPIYSTAMADRSCLFFQMVLSKFPGVPIVTVS